MQGGKSSLSPFPCLTYRIEDPKSIFRANALTFISLYLERAADHITNIGKDLIYMVTGEIRDLNH